VTGQDPAHAEYERLVERDLRRNVGAIASWEFLWGLGMPFAMLATFVPAYLGAIDAPSVLIGFVLALPAVFSASQLIVSYFVPSRRRADVYRLGIVVCLLPWLLYSLCAVLWGDAWPGPLHWALFTLVIGLFLLGANGGSSLYWEIMTDNVPPHRRGRFFGLRSMGMGLAGLGMGWAASQVLKRWETPLNFRVSLTIGTSIFLFSCLTMLLLRDHVNPRHSGEEADRPSLADYLQRTVHALWRDPNYRIFLFFLALLAIAATAAPFMVAAARKQLGVTAQAQGVFSLVFLGAVASLGWVVGLLADRFGYRLIGGLFGALLAGAFLLCLTTDRVLYWYIAYGGFALASYGMNMLLCNMSAELCPGTPPNRLMAVGNLLLVPFIICASLVNGAIVDLSGSYQPVFLANLVVSVVALMGFIFIVREPRGGSLYIVQSTPRG
jgi:MFS family permease